MDFLDSFKIELLKAPLQLAAVAGGVGLGWWLNGRTQNRARLTEARADWAAAAEECLGAVLSESSARGGASLPPNDPRAPAWASDIAERTRASHDAGTRLRAQTVKVAILDKSIGSEHELWSIERAALDLKSYEPHSTVIQKSDNISKRVQALAKTWIQ